MASVAAVSDLRSLYKASARLPSLVDVPPMAFLAKQASAEAAYKRPELPIAHVRFEQFAEGLSAQVLHVGPYANEAPTIALLHSFILEQGLIPRGLHHEIYLGDPRRSAPERLKTIIRHPVERPT